MRSQAGDRNAHHRSNLRASLRGENACPGGGRTAQARAKSGDDLVHWHNLVGKFRDHGGIQFVFCELNSGVESFRGVVRQNWYFSLRDDVSVIDFFVDVMNRTTGDILPRLERLFPSFQSRKLRQQRRMNVDDSTPKLLQ